MTRSDAHWFEDVARHLQGAYLRYSFTKGTTQEIDFLVSSLHLDSSTRVIDVGCGPGRHAIELARRGIQVHGVDISSDFIDIAREAAHSEGLESLVSFERLDARSLADVIPASSFDAAICLCQGAFGLMTANGDDSLVISGIRHCLRAGGVVALSAFNAYFAVKYHESATFDAQSGVAHELTEIRNPAGDSRTVDLWTGCYTPRELRLVLGASRFHVERILSVDPGSYAEKAPSVETSEFLVLASAV